MNSERNVVILGKVGTGKKTIGNRIVGADIFRKENAQSVGNCHRAEEWNGDTHYRILTVDTETGYCDPLQYIRQYMKTIHLIIYVIARGRLTEDTHSPLIHALQSLHPEAKPYSVLFITHCEGMTDEKRRHLVANFKADCHGSKVAALIKEIRTVGFPDLSLVAPNLQPHYEEGIVEDEKVIRGLLNDCEEPLDVQTIRSSCFGSCWKSFVGWCRDCWEPISNCWEAFCNCCGRCWNCCVVFFSCISCPFFWLYRHLRYSSLETLT